MSRDKKKEEPQVFCVHIPQNEIEDSELIATSYSSEQIAETFAFKIRARDGATELGHKEYARLIQEQLDILDKALCISEKKKKD